MVRSLEIVFSGRRISLTNKKINRLDEFVFEVSKILERYTDYVVVSGYVSILFGRSRGTEDVDFIISSLSLETFERLYNDFLENGFEFINADDPKELFEMLIEKQAVRVCKRGTIFPNAEIKLPKDKFHLEALEGKLEVMINGGKIFISPIELQIAYKLYLGGERDIEDAVFLYEIFKDHIDHEKLQYWKSQLGVEEFEL